MREPADQRFTETRLELVKPRAINHPRDHLAQGQGVAARDGEDALRVRVDGQAQRVRTLMVRDFDAIFSEVDVVASPTSPTVAFPLGERTADPYTMYLSDICTIPMSLAGLPAMSIPCGLSDGLPVGLQLAGPALSENRLFDAAHATELALGFDTRPGGTS